MPFFSNQTSGSSSKSKPWQKIVLFIGGGAFLGTALIPIIGGFLNPNAHSPGGHSTQQSITGADRELLEQQEEGFAIALERDPNNLNALQGLIQVRLDLGDLEGAKEPLGQLYERDTSNQNVLQAYITVLTELRDAEALGELESQFSATLEETPEDSLALQGITQLRLGQGDLQGALEPLDKLIELFPEETVFQQLRVQLDQELSRTNPSAAPAPGAGGNVSPLTPPPEVESNAEETP